ncbi:Upstream activation factor subunit spp27 [Morus notabilis]|uniref:Upstream activation factor subunit spp27 n=1 Tax=Morus notabilis TaxID=981085 RepID=W9RFP1_9ROSA|nr:upstream activation factor subunit spp27 [Morus notabilis]EXB70626.1 Upstream activation factor subunit spp27 [Morus notabilis]
MSSSAFRACRFLLAPTKSAAASPATKPKPKPKPKGESAQTDRRPGGLQKPVQVSPTLASFLGASQSSRANAVKQIWAHIKLHSLQNPANKREIHCDGKLKSLFDGRDKINFLEVSKLLNAHFVKTN